MKSAVAVFLVIFIFISGAACYASSPEVEEVPDEVLVVAQEGAEKLEGIMRGEFENWHFSNENEVDELELSEGIRIYHFDHTTFFSNRESLLNAIEYSVEHWLFTLNLDGQARAYVNVRRYEDRYEGSYIKDFGGDATNFGTGLELINNLLGRYDADIPLTVMSDSANYYFICEYKGNEYVLPVAPDFIDDSFYKVTSIEELVAGSEVAEMLYKNATSDYNPIGGFGLPLAAHLGETQKNTSSIWLITAISGGCLIAVFAIYYLIRNKKRT